MIKLEHVVLPSPEQMEFVIEGMRNPMNSWDKSDSYINFTVRYDDDDSEIHDLYYRIGAGDNNLMQRLARAGSCERKYLRMMPVMVRITAPLYWWKEFDTYKIATVANSCSTMHKIQEKEFTREDFSCEHIPFGSEAYSDTWDMKTSSMFFPINVDDRIYFSAEDILDMTIQALNHYRDKYLAALKTEPETGFSAKNIWWQMIQLLPSSYNQTRNVMMNYEVLANIYKWRRHHKLDEWREFCKWIETLSYFELIRSTIESDVKVYTPAEYAKEYPESAEKIQKMACGEE